MKDAFKMTLLFILSCITSIGSLYLLNNWYPFETMPQGLPVLLTIVIPITSMTVFYTISYVVLED